MSNSWSRHEFRATEGNSHTEVLNLPLAEGSKRDKYYCQKTVRQPYRSSTSGMNTDKIAHIFAVNEGSPVRVTLCDQQATIPTEPCPDRGSPPTETVPLNDFKAVVKAVDVADGGESLWVRLHLSESEWNRCGFGNHWDAENADDHGDQRMLNVWAGRFDNFEKYENIDYTPPIPDDSPVIKEWREWSGDEASFPPAPLTQPKLEMDAMYAEEVRDYGDTWETVEIGTIASVSALDDLDEWPQNREKPTPAEIWDIDEDEELLPTRHPTIDFEEIDPLAPQPEVLRALFTINRHAKKLGEAGDKAYHSNDGPTAKKHAIRKHALYDLKTIALHRIAKHDEADISLEKHNINDADYWCFYFTKNGDQWSFHQPAEAVDEAVVKQFVAEPDSIPTDEIEFTPESDTGGLSQSLEEALTILDNQGLNANEQLDQTTVTDYRFGFDTHEDIRWSHLI